MGFKFYISGEYYFICSEKNALKFLGKHAYGITVRKALIPRTVKLL